ncbi:MAG TPA: YceD family protein [Actinomycetota bacterium]
MLEIDVSALLDKPGASRRVRLEEPVAGLATELAAVPEEPPVGLEVLLESVVEGIYVTGSVWGPMRLSCARCLTDFEREFRLEVAELYAREPEEADAYPLGDGVLDLAPMIRDAVLLEMPFAPLCREDCRGLCERCGGNRNRDECSCAPRVDPRWAELEKLNLE